MEDIKEKLSKLFDIQEERATNVLETKYRAIQKSNNKIVILTILNSESTNEKEKFFEKEYSEVIGKNNNNYDIGEINGVAYCALELKNINNYQKVLQKPFIKLLLFVIGSYLTLFFSVLILAIGNDTSFFFLIGLSSLLEIFYFFYYTIKRIEPIIFTLSIFYLIFDVPINMLYVIFITLASFLIIILFYVINSKLMNKKFLTGIISIIISFIIAGFIYLNHEYYVLSDLLAVPLGVLIAIFISKYFSNIIKKNKTIKKTILEINKTKYNNILLYVLILILFLIITYNFNIVLNSYETLPGLKGKNFQLAVKLCNSKGFKPNVTEHKTHKKELDGIIKDIKIRSYKKDIITGRVKKGSWINLITYQYHLSIPNITNLHKESAIKKLEKLNFKITNIEIYSNITRKNYIIRTLPSVNSEVIYGSEIELIISKGKPQDTDDMIHIPELRIFVSKRKTNKKVKWYEALELANEKSIANNLEKFYERKEPRYRNDFWRGGYRLLTHEEWKFLFNHKSDYNISNLGDEWVLKKKRNHWGYGKTYYYSDIIDYYKPTIPHRYPQNTRKVEGFYRKKFITGERYWTSNEENIKGYFRFVKDIQFTY